MSILRRVLAHWRDHDAVLESKTTQLERLEDFGDGTAEFGDCGSGGDLLVGCEVGAFLAGVVLEIFGGCLVKLDGSVRVFCGCADVFERVRRGGGCFEGWGLASVR